MTKEVTKKICLELRAIPALTVDEESYLVREHPSFPWKRMTKSEIEEQYPDAFSDEYKGTANNNQPKREEMPRTDIGMAEITPLSLLPTSR